MKLKYSNTTILFLFYFCASAAFASTSTSDGALFRQDFEGMYNPSTSVMWSDLQVFPGSLNPSDTSDIVGIASYVPANNGTARLGSGFALQRHVSEATLAYDVKFTPNFEWVKGGKIHGLAGGTKTAGCKPIDPNGWSVRIMWRRDGQPELYIYHQDRTAECGDQYPPNVSGQESFLMAVDQWYHMEVYVKMNSSPSIANGIAELYIDGTKIVSATNLRLTGNTNVKIDTFSLTTFYGGGDPSWAPTTTTSAHFDNFLVTEGEPGTPLVALSSEATGICNGNEELVFFTATGSNSEPPYTFNWSGVSQTSGSTVNPNTAFMTTNGPATVLVEVTGNNGINTNKTISVNGSCSGSPF